MSRLARKKMVVYLMLQDLLQDTMIGLLLVIALIKVRGGGFRVRCHRIAKKYTMIERFPEQITYLNRMVRVKDSDCIDNCRMDMNTFARLCFLLRELGGLTDNKYVSVEEQVAMFLNIIGHHKKNCTIKFDFWRSGQTVSHYMHLVLKAILKLHPLLLVKPTPVPDDCTNPRWKWFKGCLGALDGTYIPVHVRKTDKPRYRTRKGEACTNVLAVCDRDMRFTYVLPGWEGSAADARILRNAVNRPHGLKISKGNYYLCDNGYANSEGFLTPYRGHRYHLDDWNQSSRQPQNYQEHFNMRHTRARNVIERAFGIMKMRWGIFRSTTYYPIKIQVRLIMACFLLHNFIRSEMPEDPLEAILDSLPVVENEDHDDRIDTTESTPESNAWRETMAREMWSDWRFT